MNIKFRCTNCRHKLKSNPADAGKQCKCTRCHTLLTIPAAAVTTPWYRQRKRVMLSVCGALLALAAGIVLIVYLINLHPVHGKIDDIKNGNARQRAAALEWLAQADADDADRANVTAALQPLLVDSDVRGGLDADLLLRTYLHWADQNNLQTMMDIVKNPDLPDWNTSKTGMVLKAIGKSADNSDGDNKLSRQAYELLAEKLADPDLGADAQSALESAGRGAEDNVVDYLFDPDAKTRDRAEKLLNDYHTPTATILGSALQQLKSKLPDSQCAAANWLARNEPDGSTDKAQQADVAKALVALLDDISSTKVNGEALAALKLWATKDTLPSLGEFARRQEAAEPGKRSDDNNKLLIELLAGWKDPAAADAIAVYLRDPNLRGKAADALLKLGPLSTDAVLHYLDHPDVDTQKEARKLAGVLKISDDRQLDQALADLADSHKPRVEVALGRLARLRPDDANRPKISKALNAPLLDADAKIREQASAAVRVWGTADNSAALVKILSIPPRGDKDCAQRTIDNVADALIAIGPPVEDSLIPLVKSAEPGIRYASVRILGEVGTPHSFAALEYAGQIYGGRDPRFFDQTQAAIAKIDARGR